MENLASKIFNEHEAAAYLGWKVATLRKKRWQGSPPKFLKLGTRSVRYRESDLKEFLNSCVRTSTSTVEA
jgi:predicted DNA-binding transcriptional regulator AlpA